MSSSEMPDDSVASDGIDPDERTYDIIGAASAVGLVVSLSLVGLLALDNIAYGLLAGVMSGGGSYLFLPWFLRFSAVQENTTGDLSTAETIERTPGQSQRGVFGLGLDIGGIVMLTIGFALEEADLLFGAAGGVAVALVVYLGGSVVLTRLRAPTG